ncbi:ACT domain-containing protein [Phosphitispora sp. TUW77]|uniref:ACT domain-containing protein n=1 Tax=Phosphitispora sp. TUW77 TaxID=3152361 RepID=UPI003AB83B74
MVREESRQYYIVAEDILPEAIKKTATVKEILARGEAGTVNTAVKKVGMSKSAFYKYRDGVFPFHRAVHNRIVTVSLLLEHKSGVLSTILNTIAAEQGNILTINQGIPLQGLANATVSIDTAGMMVPVGNLLQSVGLIKGVKKVELIGQS